MKALLKTLGIVVIATIIGFSMTACGDGSGGRGGGGGGPIPLTENQWKEGIITEEDGYIEYTISFPSIGSYRIWWNDSGDGDGSYEADIKVSAWKSNGEPIFTDVDSAWDTGKLYISIAKGETIRIRVELKDNDIANIGMFAIVFSSSSSSSSSLRPPFFPSSFTPLTANQWKDGTVANANDADWYSLSVTSGTTYYFWWNERDSGSTPYGNGTKSGDIYVSAWYSNGNPVALPSVTAPNFINRDGAWSTPITFTATSSGPVYVRVIPFLSGSSYTGTYGIVYSTSNTRPSLSFNVPTSTPLVESVWKDGNLLTSSSVDWYSISITNGSTYNLWWNERNPNGDNSKAANVKVTVFSNDGTVLLTETDTSWGSTIASFTATTAGTVYVRVKPEATGSIGTYGIVYSTTSTRPTAPFSVDATPLEELEWKNGDLPTASSMDWYSISVTQGSTYYIFCNEREFNSTSYGDGTKTGKVYVYVANEEGTFIANGRSETWSSPAQFTATYTGKVYVMVIPYYSYTGTYGIAYNTAWAIPTIPMNVVDPTPLTESEWKDGNLPASNSINWYSFPVTSGTQYRLWWNESGANGNGTKTANVSVSAWYSNGAQIFINTTTAWATARTFTASSDGTVYVRVIAENSSSSNTGTYAIVYSTANTRPAAPFNVTATLLTESEWKNGSLPTVNGVDWYSISVTDGSTYNLWWNDRGQGNSTKTGDVRVTILTNEGTILVSEKDDSWTNATPITPTYTGMVYVKVVPYSSNYLGTYGIVYSTDTTRPPVTLNGTPLTESVWQNGNLPATNSEDWYSISVTNGTTYRLWWNDSGSGNSTKTGDVKVAIFSNEGTVLVSDKDSSWSTATSITPTYTGMVYVRVVTYSSNSNYTGTYGIVYSTGSTRPAVP